ncbi:unnamed protein product [Protopolystoma xenopodis]|uniref:Dynein heavy chain coiled coil stalk domain-containing protein n=1 Tax=Protopolystoma xenopodis TaxID=117903 RepID=A0A3S5A2Q2_9PLAT|nr:unnamed protein product [Protopolystoma xenopodis]
MVNLTYLTPFPFRLLYVILYSTQVSSAAKSLCMWVRAMEVYGRVYRVVEPKRQRLQQAESVLREKQAQLAAAQKKLDEVNAEMRRLQQEYNEKVN